MIVSDESIDANNVKAQLRRFATSQEGAGGWEPIRSATISKNGSKFTVSGKYSSTATGEFEYRFAVTVNGSTVYSKPVRIFYNNAPVIYKYLPDEQLCEYGQSVPLSIACVGGSLYTWQRSTNANLSGVRWYNIANVTGPTCTISNITSTTYVRCVIENADHIIAISPICKISVSSS